MDPSDIYRPDVSAFVHKDVNQFRDFTVKEDDPITQRIFQTYMKMHTQQTVDFVKGKKRLYFINDSQIFFCKNIAANIFSIDVAIIQI